MTRALRVEWWKLKRSPVALTATLLMVVLLPLMAIGFYEVAQGEGPGALGQKAGALIVGEGWAGFLGAVDQIVAVAEFIGAGVVVAWVFGREHSDRTFASLFALPVSRGTIATAKFIVLGCWLAVLAVLVVVMTTLVGTVAAVGPLEARVIVPGLLWLLAIAVSTGLLALSIGLVASVGRGYLPAIGTLIVIVAIAQIAVLLGTGGWFPYTVPGLMAVAGTEGLPALSWIQITLVPVLSAVAILATWAWWRRTEAV
jgi:ABC-2 type transport system permease protein